MFKIAIICTSFHKKEIKKMLKKVEEVSKKIDTIELSEVYWVPGALEIPYALRKIEKEHDKGNSHNAGYVVLGIIEKGQTKHGLAMGQAVIKSIIDLQLTWNKSVGLGIIGPGAKPEHIEPRLEPHARAAIAAIAAMSNP